MKNYNKIFTDNPFIDELIYFTKTLAVNAVIKDSDKADENETVESLKAADLYIACRENRAKFEQFTYSLDFLINTEILPPAIIYECAKDNTKIPEKYRDDLLKARMKNYIENYIETNNYYRTYMGLPPIEDTKKDFVYLKEEDLVDIPELENPDYPVHLMNNQDLTILYSHGVIDNLIEEYPDKRYLKYMSDNAIDVYKARKAVNFQILYIPTVSNNELMDRWNTKYEQNRMYTLRTYYSDAYKIYSDYYNNFIIIFIILQTMIDIISEVQEFIARRDIFDDRSIRYLFESYGIPYYPEIPRVYQLAMVKNINTLLKWKASTKNMIDICSLFGFDEIDIFRYYLLRDRRVKLDGDNDKTNDDYQFHYKTIVDENGEEKVVPDNDKNYDLKFVRVPIEDKADNYLKDRTAYEDYDIITNQDDFWDGMSDHADIKSAILDQEFSWTRTKYISIDTMYDLSQMCFDLPYFINMLVDDTLLEDYLYVKIPTLKNNHQFRVSDLFVYMMALTHIYNGFEDTIMQTTTQVLSILGFNFHVDLNEVAQDIYNRYYLTLEDVGAADFDIPIYQITSFDRLLEIFRTNKNIWKIACDGMVNADNKRIYDCYKKVYDSCYIMEYTTTFFKLQNGETAQTYTEFLKERDYVLYESLTELRTYEDNTALQRAISDIIIDIVYVLEEYMDSDEFKYVFSKFPATSGDYVRTYMIKVVNFFKSYKVHLLDISTVYKAFDKRENSIKIYEDWIMSVNKTIDDYSAIIEEITYDNNLLKQDKITLLEEIYFDIERWEFKDLDDKFEFDLKTQITRMINEVKYQDSVIIVDHYKDYPFAGIQYKYEKDDKFYFLEQIDPEIIKGINEKNNILEQISITVNNEKIYANLIPGTEFNKKISELNPNATSIIFEKNGIPENRINNSVLINTSDSMYKIYMYNDNDSIIIYPEYTGVTILANQDCGNMFAFCMKLTSLDLSNFDTSNVNSMHSMFNNCSSLSSSILINTNNIDKYENIFNGCSTEPGSQFIIKYKPEFKEMAQLLYNTKSPNSNIILEEI